MEQLAPGSLPTIAIIIATYNAAAFLQQCLDSIYRQTYPNLQIIIQDGNSADDTLAIIKSNAANITYWQSAKDNGVYDAMNKALQHVTGDWVYFLGADDQLLEGFSKAAYQLKDNTVIYYGNVLMSGRTVGSIKSSYSLVKTNICHQAMFYPASVFKNSGYTFEAKYITDADHFMNMQLWNDKRYRFEYIDATVADYNDVTGLSSTRTDVAFENDRPKLVLKYFGLLAWARYTLRAYKAKARERKNKTAR